MRRMSKRERRRQYKHRRKIRKLELKAAKRKNKISGQFMNRVVVSLVLTALCFTVVMIIVFMRTGSEPSTLIDNVFRFLSVEGGIMGLIKSVKTVTKSRAKNTEIESHEDEPEQHEEE